MRALRVQYFLAFAVMGSLLPYVSAYFRQEGLSQPQIGYVLALSSVAIILSPVLVTLLADTRLDARWIMAGIFAFSAITLLLVPLAHGFVPILLIWAAHNIAFVAVQPLEDGINFAIQEQRRRRGEPLTPYHHIRVWGTIGFILPSLVLFAFLWAGYSLKLSLWSGAGFAALGLLNTLFLPDPLIRARPDPASALPDSARLPTFGAARAMLRRPVFIFCVATFLLHGAVTAYYGFYPIYLTERLGLGRQWLGLANNLGVVVEIFFMLSFGWWLRMLGLKRLMVLGAMCIALRMALLAVPSVALAIGSQILHGPMVLVLQVAPPVFLNRDADDRYRHSIQGLYTMLIVGVSRIVGNLLAGPLAKWSLTGLYGCAAAVCLVAAGLVVLAFSDAHAPAGVRCEPK